MQQDHHGDDRGRDPGVTAILERGTDGDDSDEDDTLTKDDIFEVLYNERRREIIAYLQENDETSTVSDLAEHIAAKENDTTVQALSSYERKRVYVGLYQNHLPMMDDVGVVDYNKNRGTVELEECASQLEPHLSDPEDFETSYMKIAGAVGLAGILMLGVLNVGIFAVASDLLWVTIGVVGLFLLAVHSEYDPLSN